MIKMNVVLNIYGTSNGKTLTYGNLMESPFGSLGALEVQGCLTTDALKYVNSDTYLQVFDEA